MLSFFPSSPLMLSLPSCVFGCVAFVHSHNPHRGQLDPRAVKCVFIGYPSNKKVILCLSSTLGGELSRSRVCHRVITFSYSGCSSSITKPILVLEQVQMSEPNVSIPDNSIKEQVQFILYLNLCIDHLCVQHQSFIVVIDAIKTPTLVQEALKDENWVQKMKEEMKALEKKSTWEIVDRPKDKIVVGCRWIYTMKCKSNGTLERYKARLVVKGYTQTYRIDY
ncbi:putative mitochondrial protein, partial [Mucuna pruriens]